MGSVTRLWSMDHNYRRDPARMGKWNGAAVGSVGRLHSADIGGDGAPNKMADKPSSSPPSRVVFA